MGYAALNMNNTASALRYKPTNFIDDVIEDLKIAYLSDSKPWVVGFSGGKDSTALVQFVFYMLMELPPRQRHKKVFIIASDTLVEMPSIEKRIMQEVSLMQEAAEKHNLPIEVHRVYPELLNRFWVSLIGKGYPSPVSRFRWCTDRLKIDPTSKFIREKVSQFGAVVIVLGSRIAESSTRAQIMEAYRIEGQRFRPHKSLAKAWVYMPIQDLSNNQVWDYLLTLDNPWEGDNEGLAMLYKMASGGECPMVIDETTPPCGNSRFGCWTCTVVERDKSMESLVASGEEKFKPLLEFRDYLREIRGQDWARMNKRKNGSEGKGPFTYEVRHDLLKRLLRLQKEVDEVLIQGDELAAIKEMWALEGQPVDMVDRIWRHVYEEEPMPEGKENPALSKEEQLLEDVCKEYEIPFEMMRRLRDLEEEYGSLRRRHGLPELMRETVKQAV